MKMCSIGSTQTATTVFEFYCPKDEAEINSGIGVDTVSYYQIRLARCDGSKGVACKSDEEIDEYIPYMQLLVYFGETVFQDGELLLTWSQYNGYITWRTPGKRGGFDMIVRKYYIIVKPDFLTALFPSNYEGIKSNYYDSIIKERYPGDLSLFTVTITLDTSFVREIYFRPTVFDILGQTGSLFNITVLLIGIYMWNYNKNHFYQRYPGWDNLNDNLTGNAEDLKLLEKKDRTKNGKKKEIEAIEIDPGDVRRDFKYSLNRHLKEMSKKNLKGRDSTPSSPAKRGNGKRNGRNLDDSYSQPRAHHNNEEDGSSRQVSERKKRGSSNRGRVFDNV
jgi:hypothetical protein